MAAATGAPHRASAQFLITGLLGVALVLSLLGSAAKAQDDKLRAYVNLDGKGSADLMKGLALRPNATESAVILLENPANLAKKVQAKLMIPQKSGEPAVEFASADLEIEGGKTVAITQWKLPASPTPPPPPAGTPVTPIPAVAFAPAPQLEGLPFRFQLWLTVDKATEPEKLAVPVTILQPSVYITKPQATFKGDRLEVTLKTDEAFKGPPCIVNLDVRPERIPGLVPAKAAGVYRQILKDANQSAKLFAEKLKFLAGTRPVGRFYITVDGCERAFTFESNFTSLGEGATPKSLEDRDLRLVAGRVMKAGDKLPVRVEADNVPWDSTVLRVGIDRDGSGKLEGAEIQEFRGARDQQVKLLPPAKDGSLTLQTIVKDWVIDLDIAEVLGTYKVQAWLADKDDETKTLISAETTVTLDATPPEDVHFTVPEKTRPVRRGTLLAVAAAGDDPESGIQEVQFFLGKPTVDHKPPPNAAPVKAVKNLKEGVWIANLPLPAEGKGLIDLGVIFINGAGLASSSTVAVELVEAAAVAAAKASIEVAVVEGDRPQNDLPVVLRDSANAVKGTLKTEKGKVTFKDLPPGDYKVSSLKTASNTKGETAVSLKEGEAKKVGISLFR
ncbi:MAG: hypothetical protein ACJ8FY_29070 [Gemmataceae bacterium]